MRVRVWCVTERPSVRACRCGEEEEEYTHAHERRPERQREGEGGVRVCIGVELDSCVVGGCGTKTGGEVQLRGATPHTHPLFQQQPRPHHHGHKAKQNKTKQAYL